MHKLGSSTKNIVKLCRILNNEIYVYVKVKTGKYLSSEFKVNKILRQGDAIVPLLLNVVVEISVRSFKAETPGNLLNKCSQIAADFNDVTIMGTRLQDVGKAFTSLVEKTNKMGLEINKKSYYSNMKPLQ
jgi:hypothetical protein